MKTMQTVEVMNTLSIRYSGASVWRQIAEQKLTLPDESLLLVWAILVLADYLFNRAYQVYDFLFVGWAADLYLIKEAIRYAFIPTQKTAV